MRWVGDRTPPPPRDLDRFRNTSSPYRHRSVSASYAARYLMTAAVMADPAPTAGSSSDGWNRKTLLPSVLVPSGNSRTGASVSSTAAICRATVSLLARLCPPRKRVPPARAKDPSAGHVLNRGFLFRRQTVTHWTTRALAAGPMPGLYGAAISGSPRVGRTVLSAGQKGATRPSCDVRENRT